MNGNMNNNVNEQELILRKKIEKREKMDTILAYILIIILVACIGIILYLKFIRKEETISPPNEYVPNYISLSEISTSLNSSTLANRYMNDDATFTSTVSGNSIVITYTKEDNVINLNVPAVGNELEFTMSDDNSDIVTDIYKEVANIVCIYYGNTETSCRNTIDNVNSSSSIEGIRYGDNNTVYITTTKSIDVVNETVYYSVTKTSIDNTNYTLNLSNIKINNIVIDKYDDAIRFSGNVSRLTGDKDKFSIVIKLYDLDGNMLEENSMDYEADDTLEENNSFVISFTFDTLRNENISEYSINVVK